MLLGKIKVWNQSNGWGFIEGDNGEDYFLNIKNLRPGQSMGIGLRVKFDTQESQQGPQAVNVTLY
jgi:cold shock CspA family protein